MATYPGEIDTRDTLFQTSNRARTQLANGFPASAGPGAEIIIEDPTNFPLGNLRFLVSVTDEIIICSGRVSNRLIIEERGFEGTVPVDHSIGEICAHAYTSRQREIIVDAHRDIQRYLFNYRGRIINKTSSDPTLFIPNSGDQYIVQPTAVNDWTGQEGNLAYWSNDGEWHFNTPQQGWRVWDIDTEQMLLHDGTEWVPDLPIAPYDSTVAWPAGHIFLENGGLWLSPGVPAGTPFDVQTFLPLTGAASSPIDLWEQDTFYRRGQLVVDGVTGSLYTAIVDHTSPATGTLQDDIDNWLATSGKYRGDYDDRVEYSRADVIQHDQRFWYAVNDITSGSGNPDINSDWVQYTTPPETRDNEFFITNNVDETGRVGFRADLILPNTDRFVVMADREMDLGRLVSDYEGGVNYEVGEIVIDATIIYQCANQIVNSPFPRNPLDWVQLTSLGGGGGPGGSDRTTVLITVDTIATSVQYDENTFYVADTTNNPITLTLSDQIAQQGALISLLNIGPNPAAIQAAGPVQINGVFGGRIEIPRQYELADTLQVSIAGQSWAWDDSFVKYDINNDINARRNVDATNGNLTTRTARLAHNSPTLFIQDNTRDINANNLQGSIQFVDQSNLRYMFMGQFSNTTLDTGIQHEGNFGGKLFFRNIATGGGGDNGIVMSTTDGDVDINVAGELDIDTTNNVDIDAGGNVDIDAGGTLNLTSSLVSMNTNVARVFGTAPALTIRDSNTNPSNAMQGHIDFRGSNNTRTFYLGTASSSNREYIILAENIGGDNLRLQVNGGGIIRGSESRGSQSLIPAARVQFESRSSNGNCTIINALNVGTVQRIGTGTYQINFQSGSVGGTALATNGLTVVGAAKATIDFRQVQIRSWGSSPAQITVNYRDQNNTNRDPDGGSSRWQTVMVYVP